MSRYAGAPGWPRCVASTKDGDQCRLYCEPWRGRALCHVHDPDGVYAQQHPKHQSRMRATYDPMWKAQTR